MLRPHSLEIGTGSVAASVLCLATEPQLAKTLHQGPKRKDSGALIHKSYPVGTTNYLYDGAGLLEEVDNSGNVLARYTKGTSTDDEGLSELRAGTASYYEQDGLGSVGSLSNNVGALTRSYTYDSYGKIIASTGTLTNPLQYIGRELDSEAGLYYDRARYYDPASGRFLSEDPIGFDGGGNFYAYVQNDPIDGSDPDGLTRKDRWYGHNDPDFHKWFHRCWKQPGDPDADKSGIEEAYDEWVQRGKPRGGRCYNGPKDCKCNQKTTFEYQIDEQSNRYMEQFWKDILIGDGLLGAVGVAGAVGLLGEGCIGASGAGAGGAGGAPPPPPAPPLPMPGPPPPIPLVPAA